ncbi:MAG TPA: hypothetical protein VLH59_04315 [Ignavibacteriaceae bacterium]|nr:hypothetical protein [Ignavibacteriaceae bacterium]
MSFQTVRQVQALSLSIIELAKEKLDEAKVMIVLATADENDDKVGRQEVI